MDYVESIGINRFEVNKARKNAQIRILNGLLKGDKYSIQLDTDVRPTSQKVREAAFQIWAEYIEGSVFLDPFTGSGAMVLEALSRGADEIYTSDIRSDYLFNLRKVLSDINKRRHGSIEKDRIIITCEDYRESLSNHFSNRRKFDLVYLDPPYQSGFGIEAVKLIHRYDLMSENGLILLEVSRRETRETNHFLESFESALLLKKYKYGDTYLFHIAIDGDPE